MKTRMIIIRHGQSIANAQSRFAGHSDFDLTELGHEQARRAAEYLYNSGEKIDKIYSSDLLRAHNTAAPFAQKYDLPINDTEGLREIFAGKWESMRVEDIFEQDKDAFVIWRTDIANARCTGGESTQELYTRIISFVKELAKENEGKTILLATHATPIRAIECCSHGWGGERLGDVNFVRNSALNIYEYEDGEIRAIKTDIVDHLDPDMITKVPKNLDDINKK